MALGQTTPRLCLRLSEAEDPGGLRRHGSLRNVISTMTSQELCKLGPGKQEIEPVHEFAQGAGNEHAEPAGLLPSYLRGAVVMYVDGGHSLVVT